MLKQLKKLLAEPRRSSRPERRGSPRVQLPVPVSIRIGDGPLLRRRLHDLSSTGLGIEGGGEGERGETVSIQFQGYPGICEAFTLRGRLAHVGSDESRPLGVQIDRQATPPEALDQYRQLVLHYIRHKPLLQGIDRGLFEARCEGCGWIGKVSDRKPQCSKCGGPVEPVTLG